MPSLPADPARTRSRRWPGRRGSPCSEARSCANRRAAAGTTPPCFLDSAGEERLRYRKIHLPDEEGYWEAHHYEPGDRLHPPVEVGGFGIGVQVCSDANRPQGCNCARARWGPR